MPVVGKRFNNFLNLFAIFFGIFLPRSSKNGILERNFVFTFSVYLIPFSLKIMPGRGFMVFWIFLLFFFQNFLARFEYERNSGLKFCFDFGGISNPVWAKNNAGRGFIIFWIFLLFFSEYSCPGRVWTEFFSEILISLFRSISSRFG